MDLIEVTAVDRDDAVANLETERLRLAPVLHEAHTVPSLGEVRYTEAERQRGVESDRRFFCTAAALFAQLRAAGAQLQRNASTKSRDVVGHLRVTPEASTVYSCTRPQNCR